jgi:hypothetical protein
MVSLTEFITANKPKKFSSRPYYSERGDALTLFFKDEESYAERIDSLLTVYRSVKTEEVIGCEIKGVQNILKKLGSFGVNMESSKLNVSLLFLGYYSTLAEQQSVGPRQQIESALIQSKAHIKRAELAALA